MGEIAEMILEGILDEQTGEYLGKPCGYPKTLVKKQYNIVKKQKPKYFKKTPSEKKIAAIRKEIAILVNKHGIEINEARKQMNIKYGKGWRERGLISNSEDQWSEEDLKDFN